MSKSILSGEAMTHFDGTYQFGMFQLCYQKKFLYYFTEKKRQVNIRFRWIKHGRRELSKRQ
jgi:hypothetical protein